VTLGQNLILLLVTAALTGLLVPIVKDLIDQRRLAKQSVFEDERLRAQREFEAELARQTKIIDAQAELLDELARTLWGFEKLVLRFTYYGAGGDFNKFVQAFDTFDSEAWDLLADLLAVTSKARRLAPPEAHEKLQGLYRELVEEVSPAVEPMRHFKADCESTLSADQRAECLRLNRLVYDHLAPHIDEVLAGLADDFRLSARQPTEQIAGVGNSTPSQRK
jgi:hypothetical protein